MHQDLSAQTPRGVGAGFHWIKGLAGGYMYISTPVVNHSLVVVIRPQNGVEMNSSNLVNCHARY